LNEAKRQKKQRITVGCSGLNRGPSTVTAAHLDASAKMLWKAIVSDSPSGWFTVAQEPLLAGFCSHASTAEFISKLIEKERPDDLLEDRDKFVAIAGCSE
jgi:hypothetical protein